MSKTGGSRGHMTRRFFTDVVQGSFFAEGRRGRPLPTPGAILLGVVLGAAAVAAMNWYRPALLPVRPTMVAAHCPEVAEFRQQLNEAHQPGVDRDRQSDEFWQAASLWAHAVDKFPECFTAKDEVTAKAYLDAWRLRMEN